jgi:hypothetical protein
MPPGEVENSALRAGTEEVVGRASALSRAGWRTYVYMVPLDGSQR